MCQGGVSFCASYKLNGIGEHPRPALSQFTRVDTDVAINDEDGVRFVRADNILVVHVAQVDVGSDVRPVAGIL